MNGLSGELNQAEDWLHEHEDLSSNLLNTNLRAREGYQRPVTTVIEEGRDWRIAKVCWLPV